MEIRVTVRFGEVRELVSNEKRDVLDVVFRDQFVVFGRLDRGDPFLKDPVLLFEKVVGVNAGQVFLDQRLPGLVKLFEFAVGAFPSAVQRGDPLEVGLAQVRAHQVNRFGGQAEAVQKGRGLVLNVFRPHRTAFSAPFLAEIIGVAAVLSLAPAGGERHAAAAALHDPP